MLVFAKTTTLRTLGFVVLSLTLTSLVSCHQKSNKDFKIAPCDTVAPFISKELPKPAALKNARCGFLKVPENRSNVNGPTIQLAVVIVPSITQPKASDPIVYLAGGPGGSAILELDMLVNAGLNKHRDLILMSQRGTLFSNPELMCPELDNYYLKSISMPLDSDRARNLHIESSKACHVRLSKQGIDFNAYNTVENAADFAALKKSLGLSSWNIYAVSYGTYLAQTLMRQHPEGIRSVILDSVVPLEESQIVAEAANNAKEAFHAIFTACANQPKCNKAYPNLSNTFTKLVNQLETKPAKAELSLTKNSTPVDAVLDGGALVNWLIDESFNTANFPNIPQLIAGLDKGEAKSILNARAQPFLIPKEVLAYGMTFGMICSGYMADETPKDVLSKGKEAFPDYPDSVLAPALHYSYAHEDCAIWNIAKTPKALREAIKSPIPTLILSGTFDAITPPSQGSIAAKTLPNAIVLNFPGVGHGVIQASLCAKEVFESFLSNPKTPNTDCVKTLKTSQFN